MNVVSPNESISGSRAEAEDIAALTHARLGELRRLAEIGMAKAERLSVVTQALPPEEEIKQLTGRNGSVAEFIRVTRAVRQVIVLEFELRGLLPAPDREAVREPRDRDEIERPERLGTERDRNDLNDLKDRGDYSRGPLDEVVADVRKAIDAEAPQNDPFAPPPGRRPRVSAADRRTAVKRKSEIRQRVSAAVKAGVKTTPSLKSALLRGASVPRPALSDSPIAVPRAMNHLRTRGPPK